MFAGWDEFYLLIGGAAGGLIGLLFIVITLIRGGETGLKLRGASVFMTPTVAHLAMVLVLSALATAPRLSAPVTGALFLAGAAACLTFTGRALFMLVGGSVKATHWSDLWGYGVAPFLATLALAVSAAAAWIAPDWAARGIAASVVAMLLIAIRNAWDLVTWISAKGGVLDREEG
ncbi:hypothetical protein [Phenylobacterium sp.]|jgi:hypothetical protein|uniref:hypothetical protein n=1 Tax=Phenylobacterium sp. TaxID=1871053 RepID=UPI002E367DB2|nr:hypothetical protein [Phenylobacterium sp.]HEX3366641.1 hypothetical protein [Phenylobacterium sp.]